MARNINVSSVTFGSQSLRQPMSYRVAATAETVEDNAGVDDHITSHQIVRARIEVQVAFKDWTDAIDLLRLLGQNSAWQAENTLTVVTRDLASTTTRTASWANARLRDVIVDAVHDDPGTHIAIFVVRSTSGSGITTTVS